VDDLRESLPEHQPRYVVYSYRMEHADGRVSYPMCFIYITPRGRKLLFQTLSLCEYVYKFPYIFKFQIGLSKDNIIIMELRF
jgi:hypothetical protein